MRARRFFLCGLENFRSVKLRRKNAIFLNGNEQRQKGINPVVLLFLYEFDSLNLELFGLFLLCKLRCIARTSILVNYWWEHGF